MKSKGQPLTNHVLKFIVHRLKQQVVNTALVVAAYTSENMTEKLLSTHGKDTLQQHETLATQVKHNNSSRDG